MNSRGRRIAAGVVALAAVAAGTVVSLLSRNTVYPGVTVGEVDVGGLGIEPARSRLASRGAELAKERVVLRCAGRSFDTTIGGMGGKVDVGASVQAAYRIGREGHVFHRIANVISAWWHGRKVPVTYAFNKDLAFRYLSTVAQKIDRRPTNAEPVLESGGVRVIPHKPGIKLDVERSLARIVREINSGVRAISLEAATVAPKVTTADLEGINGVLAAYSTPYNPWERDRTHNLKIACQAINGTLVKAGETFSYNGTVGPRLRKYGFRDAPMFVRGEIEPGTGGGVCQVSTTVYNAALLADMKILARSHHSRPVVYAPVRRDATVAYPAIDLKFENTTGAPIYILASVGKRTVNVSILGKRLDDREVEIVAVGHQVIRAPVRQTIEEDLEPGKRIVRSGGRPGHRLSIYRIVKLGGKVIKKELISNDYYGPESRVEAVPQPAPQSQPTSM